jgi:hypothetical protein
VKPLLKIVLIVEWHQYRTSPCGDDKKIYLLKKTQQNGAVAGDWRLDIKNIATVFIFLSNFAL